MLIVRDAHIQITDKLLRSFPVVAIVGARQVGKTTLANQIAAKGRFKRVTRFDLESPADLARLADPMVALEPLRGLVILDEVQRLPDVFPLLRVLADRARTPARFLVLGSASPELLRQSSESLAGRIAYHELRGLNLGEVGDSNMSRLWLRGGFPRSYLARSHGESMTWREQFIRTFLERDLPQLGIRTAAQTLRRFWTMLAHYHGQQWNASELARALGADYKTAQHYLDILTSTFVVRILQPWFANVKKRQVKAPKTYIADSGLLHALLDLGDQHQLEGHPKVGASWEGFVIEQLCTHLEIAPEDAFFWGTHAGPELDLVISQRGRLHGFEIKRTAAPKVTVSMLKAQGALDLDSLTVIHAGQDSFMLGHDVKAIAARRILEDI
jgi:predicted AAA+ superfamily ATPase